MDLVLNNLQRLICHKTQQTKPNQVLLWITHNSIKHQSFIYIQLNGERVLFLTIWFNVNHLFAHCFNIKQFYLTHLDPIRCYHCRSEWTGEQWQWRGTPHSPNLQNWSLTIRLFNVICRTPVRGVIFPCRDAVIVFCRFSQLLKIRKKYRNLITAHNTDFWSSVEWPFIQHHHNYKYNIFPMCYVFLWTWKWV